MAIGVQSEMNIRDLCTISHHTFVLYNLTFNTKPMYKNTYVASEVAKNVSFQMYGGWMLYDIFAVAL